MTSSDKVYIHSSFGRALYDRLKRDESLRNFDKAQWYHVDLSHMSATHSRLFVQLSLDAAGEAFVARCHERADWLATQVWHSLASWLLSPFMSQTSINGWLGRGSMFVWSRDQFEQLLTGRPAVAGGRSSWRGRRLLDIGAGDGHVTDVMAASFDHVLVTEASPVMRKSLAAKNYTVLDVDSWHQQLASQEVLPQKDVDVEEDGRSVGGACDLLITCLNVLDRCDRPLSLLQTMSNCLRHCDAHDEQINTIPNESPLLIVAVVLPLSFYVENGENRDHSPVEPLVVKGSTFVEQVSSLIEDVFTPAGLEVVRWSRLPYLCEGDMNQAFYWLDDAVFVLRPLSSTHHSL